MLNLLKKTYYTHFPYWFAQAQLFGHANFWYYISSAQYMYIVQINISCLYFYADFCMFTRPF